MATNYVTPFKICRPDVNTIRFFYKNSEGAAPNDVAPSGSQSSFFLVKYSVNVSF